MAYQLYEADDTCATLGNPILHVRTRQLGGIRPNVLRCRRKVSLSAVLAFSIKICNASICQAHDTMAGLEIVALQIRRRDTDNTTPRLCATATRPAHEPARAHARNDAMNRQLPDVGLDERDELTYTQDATIHRHNRQHVFVADERQHAKPTHRRKKRHATFNHAAKSLQLPWVRQVQFTAWQNKR
jgi:hypothetical protein